MVSLSAEPAGAGAASALDRASCLALLGSQPFGRVVFTQRALPAVLPVGFLLHDSGVLLRIGPGSELAAVADGAVVAFQVDRLDPEAHDGWSVTVVGRAEQVSDPALRVRVQAELAPWADGARDSVVRISLEQVTGRRLIPGPSDQ